MPPKPTTSNAINVQGTISQLTAGDQIGRGVVRSATAHEDGTATVELALLTFAESVVPVGALIELKGLVAS